MYKPNSFLRDLTAADKKSQKLDPKAKVRSRGKVVFPAESPKIKDKKDHFPINDADQARNALARVGQYDKVPPWYKGTLTELKNAVQRAVHKHYKGIEIGDKKASYIQRIIKNADQLAEDLLNQNVLPLDDLSLDASFNDLNRLSQFQPEIDAVDVPVDDLQSLAKL